MKHPHTKAPYRFTVGLGEHASHLLILAADERTREWALSAQARISVVTRTVTDELAGRTIVDGPFVGAGPDVVPLERVMTRFAELLATAFPRQAFEVRAPVENVPAIAVAMDTSTTAYQSMIAHLAEEQHEALKRVLLPQSLVDGSGSARAQAMAHEAMRRRMRG